MHAAKIRIRSVERELVRVKNPEDLL